MIIEKNIDRQGPKFIPKAFETKKLTWKDKFRRDLFRQNLKLIQMAQARRKKDIKEEDQKRSAARHLSKLFDKKTLYLSDPQQQFPHHGHYSSFIPLTQQVKLTDQLRSTFPYIQYLSQKSHQQTKINVYNQISNHLGMAVEKNGVEGAWRSCLRKYMCGLDTVRAVEVYVEVLKRGTGVVGELHRRYGGGCSLEVFFHRFCQSSKYFKQTNKINKNIKTSIELNDQISQVTLPKTSKCLFCPICLVYDCNQHNVDDTVSDFNFQYVARENIISTETHVSRILSLIRFQKQITTTPQQVSSSNQPHPPSLMQSQHGQLPANLDACSSTCYKHLNTLTYTKKSTQRRPIISLIHRSLIAMGIEMFSYDPCLLFLWIGKQGIKQQGRQTQQVNRGVNCENVFFYLMEEYGLGRKLQQKLYKTEVEWLMGEGSRPQNETKASVMLPNNKKKKHLKPRFDHADNQNYRIGCCFHYIIGQQVFDHNCQRCCCKARGFCLPECQCPPSCQIKKLGCSCKSKDDCRNKKCDCFQNNQQCIPSLCHNCFDTFNIRNKKNSCRNTLIQRQQTKYIRVGDSNICGLGAFAGEDIKKDDLVVIYSGEMIQHQIDYMRECLRLDETFYNFGLNESGAIDARFMGNKSRFINHQKGGEENLLSASMFTEGQFRTVLYAKKNIKKGQQLYFNYDVGGQISTNFPGKYDFIKKSKR